MDMGPLTQIYHTLYTFVSVLLAQKIDKTLAFKVKGSILSVWYRNTPKIHVYAPVTITAYLLNVTFWKI